MSRASHLTMRVENPRPASAIMTDIGGHLSSMITIQASAYPSHWSEAERREMAELHLFGDGK